MHARARMRSSNRKAVNWLLANSFDDIVLIPHTRRKLWIYCRDCRYPATDLYNLFDGFCYKVDGNLKRHCYLQIKTNAFPPSQPILDFLAGRPGEMALAINVIEKKRKKTKIVVRYYEVSSLKTEDAL